MYRANFGSVGKSVIIRAIGLQANFKDNSDKLDEKASGCFSCPHFLVKEKYKKNSGCEEYESADSACVKCTKKVYISKYVNESNRYGYSHPLSLCAIKIFLYLHLLSPTSIGVVGGVHVPTIARELKCSEKTVHSCLRNLQEYGYIYYRRDQERGCYLIILLEYQEYFKPAAKGGRGYFILSRQLFEKLIKVNQLNIMRLYIRMYLNIELNRQKYPKREPIRKDTKSLAELRNYLPAYLKPCNIIQMISVESDIYNIEIREKITFTLGPSLYGADIKKQILKENEERLLIHIFETDNILSERYRCWMPEDAVPTYLMQTVENMVKTKVIAQVAVSEKDIQDMVQMSVQYSFEHVICVLHQIWETNLVGSLYGKYGAIMRNMIEQEISNTAV